MADLINVGIEALVKARYELPAFSRLGRAAQVARAHVNQGYYQVYNVLDDLQRQAITALLTRDDHEPTSPWQRGERYNIPEGDLGQHQVAAAAVTQLAYLRRELGPLG